MAQDSLSSSLRAFRRPGHESAGMEQSGIEAAQSIVRLVLHIGEGPARPLPLDLTGRLVLGIATNEEALQPDIDLNRFGGRQAGVQRRHATLMNDQNQVYIEAFNTEGGTRINGLPLLPGKRYLLRNHDELELGALRMLLRFMPR